MSAILIKPQCDDCGRWFNEHFLEGYVYIHLDSNCSGIVYSLVSLSNDVAMSEAVVSHPSWRADELTIRKPTHQPLTRKLSSLASYPCNVSLQQLPMMTLLSGNIFRVTGPLWGESAGHRWIPLTKSRDAELWCFLWSAPERNIKQTIEAPMIWNAIVLIMTSL